MRLSLGLPIKRISKYLFRLLFTWSVFWYFCRPIVVIHYSPEAPSDVAYFFLENSHTTKSAINPGERIRFYTDMFPEPDELIDFSLPFSSRDGVEIHPPFSRVDIYVDAGSHIERTLISQNFFARFYKTDE
ncbi:hypothetical protein [Pseudomonas sp. RIT-PI-AD]|uniref:hypothetical protein n=1 Tax=Pseudomonas sp. RIT-PI-AD TaxID=3035294 RepID=UPI0021DAA45F|nr:hypothetical protein [Pseudomonas sp. RIT-PI-AD]